jgi:hypothetical protein
VDQQFDSWVGQGTGGDFEAVFGVDASFDPHMLLDEAWLGWARGVLECPP